MKYMKNKNIATIAAILTAAFIIRFYDIGNNPSSLTADEAALGYNAYSILKTGRDEHGALLPVIFKSFGDYKPGLYVYLTIPFVAFLGLTEVAVRLPSVLGGTLSVLFMYLLMKKLFGQKTAYISSLLLAINPWSVHFSRGAWEVNIALLLTIMAVYFFLIALNKNKYLIFSAIAFGLTLWTYQGAKFMSLFLLIFLLALFYQQFIKIRFKYLLISIITGLIFLLPVAMSFFKGQTGRLSVFSVFSYPRPSQYRDAFISQANVKVGSTAYYLFYSEPYNFLRGILGRYFNHYSTDFLFFTGDWQNPRHSPPYHGMMLLASIVTIPVGLFNLFRRFDKNRALVLLWLLLAPLPAALSRDQVHAVRALYLSVPLIILAALGVASLYEKFSKKALVILIFSYIVSFLLFVDAEFVHLPELQARQWGYGYKQMALEIDKIADDSTVFVEQSYNQPYIYYLFYSQYDPLEYQNANSFKESGNADVGLVEKVGNVYFQDLNWGEIYATDNSYLIVSAVTLPLNKISQTPKLSLSKEIDYPDGTAAFYVLKVNETE